MEESDGAGAGVGTFDGDRCYGNEKSPRNGGLSKLSAGGVSYGRAPGQIHVELRA
jgi:hypothetical protein